MGKWVRVDRRYNQPFRLTGHAVRAVLKWTGLVFLWLAVLGMRSGVLDLIATMALGAYGLRRQIAALPITRRALSSRRLAPGPPPYYRLNPPPGRPPPPPGWQPDRSGCQPRPAGSYGCTPLRGETRLLRAPGR